MKNNLKIAIIVAVVFFGIGYFSKPTKIKTELKEVIKTEVVKEEAKSKIIEKEKIIYKDGTIIEREKTVDISKIKTEMKQKIEKELKTEQINNIGLNISLLAIKPINKQELEYGIHVNKRILGNISVGAFADTEKKIGVSIGVNF